MTPNHPEKRQPQKSDIEAEQRRIDALDGVQDQAVRVGKNPEQLGEIYIQRTNRLQGKIRDLRRLSDGMRAGKTDGWKKIDDACSSVETDLMNLLKSIDRRSVESAADEFADAMDALFRKAAGIERPIRLPDTPQRIGLVAEREHAIDVLKALEQTLQTQKTLLTREMEGLAKNTKASEDDAQIGRNLSMVRYVREQLVDTQKQMASAAAAVSQLDLRIAHLDIDEARNSGKTEIAKRLLLKVKDEYGERLKQIDPELHAEAQQIIDGNDLSLFEKQLYGKTKGNAVETAVAEAVDAQKQADIVDQLEAAKEEKKSQAFTLETYAYPQSRSHIRVQIVDKDAKPYPHLLQTLKTASGKRCEGVRITKEALELMNRPAPEGMTLVLTRIPRSVTLSEIEYWQPRRNAETQQRRRVMNSDIITVEDMAYATIDGDRLVTHYKDISTQGSVADITRKREESGHDIVRAIDQDASIKQTIGTASRIGESLTHLQGLLSAGNVGTKRQAFVDFARSEAGPMLALLKKTETQTSLNEALSQLHRLKQMHLGVALGGVEQEIDARIRGLEEFGKLLQSHQVEHIFQTILDKSTFDADTWANWASTDLPKMLAAIAVATAVIVTVTLSAGGATPLWVVALGGAAGGIIGNELAAEAIHEYHNRFDADVTSGKLRYTDRSRIRKYGEGQKIFDAATGKYVDMEFVKDVASPYLQEFTISFITTYATVGLGSLAATRLSTLCQNSAWVQAFMQKNPAAMRVGKWLSTVSEAARNTDKQTFLRQWMGETLDELTDEFVREKGVEIVLTQIDKRLGPVAALAVIMLRGFKPLKVPLKAGSFLGEFEIEGAETPDEAMQILRAFGYQAGIDQNGTLKATDREGHEFTVVMKQTETIAPTQEAVTSETDQTNVVPEEVAANIPEVERTLTEEQVQRAEERIHMELDRDPRDEDIQKYMQEIADVASAQKVKLLTEIYKCCQQNKKGCIQVNECRKKEGISDHENALALAQFIIMEGSNGLDDLADMKNELVRLIAQDTEASEQLATALRRQLPKALQIGALGTVNIKQSDDLFIEATLRTIGHPMTPEEINEAKADAIMHILNDGESNNDETVEWLNDRRIEGIIRLASVKNIDALFSVEHVTPTAGITVSEEMRQAARNSLRTALHTSKPETFADFVAVFGLSESDVKEEGVAYIREKLAGMQSPPTPVSRRFQSTAREGSSGTVIMHIKTIMEKAKVAGADIETEALAVMEHMLDNKQDEFVPIIIEELSIDPAKLLDDRFKEKIKASIKEKLQKAEEGDGFLDQYFAYWRAIDNCSIYHEALEAHLMASMGLEIARGPRFTSSQEKGVRKLFSILKKLPDGMRISETLQDRAQKWVESKTGNGEYKNVMEIGALMGVDSTAPSFAEAAKNGLVTLLSHRGYNPDLLPDIQYFIQATGLDVDVAMKDERLKREAVGKLHNELTSGDEGDAVFLRNLLHLQAEFDSPDSYAAALKGAAALLLNDRIDAMQDFAKCMKIKDHDLARHISRGLDSGDCPHEKIINNLLTISDGIVERIDPKYAFSDYKKDVGILSVAIYEEYARLRNENGPTASKGFAAEIRERRDSLISNKKQDASIVDEPFYKELVIATFPNHAGNFYNYNSTESCADRSDDLAQYTVRENYSFTVKPGSEMRIRDGAAQDPEALARIERPIRDAGYGDGGNDMERSKAILTQRLADKVSKVRLEACCKTEEEQLLGLILKNMTGEVPTNEMCDLLVGYHLSRSPDTEQYVGGTRGNVEMAKNKEYQHLLELHEFYGDRMKDATRKICEQALTNPEVRALLPLYFKKLTDQKNQAQQKELLARLRVAKLGLSPDFLVQIGKTLEREQGRKFTDDEIRATVRAYEAGTLQGAPSKAITGMLGKQRRDTLSALQKLNGPATDMPAHLEDVTFEGTGTNSESTEVFDEQKFAALLVEDAKTILASPLKDIEGELNKYEAVDSDKGPKKKKRVEAYITKNHTSAHARGVAGVCTSKDTPMQYADENQWDKSNYLQMVLRDGDTKICQGCVLIYIEEHHGKRVLTASFNPSSTYLFSVNESEMFAEMQKQLVAFAQDNNIDAVGLSRNKNIRTNRTGGEFEKAMARAVKECGREIVFDEDRFFSTFNKYTQKEIDLVWAKKPEEFGENTSSEMAE